IAATHPDNPEVQSIYGEILARVAAITAPSPPLAEPPAETPLAGGASQTTQQPTELCAGVSIWDASIPNPASHRARRPILLGLSFTVLILLGAGAYKLAQG